jgi:hypothetical protein
MRIAQLVDAASSDFDGAIAAVPVAGGSPAIGEVAVRTALVGDFQLGPVGAAMATLSTDPQWRGRLAAGADFPTPPAPRRRRWLGRSRDAPSVREDEAELVSHTARLLEYPAAGVGWPARRSSASVCTTPRRAGDRSSTRSSVRPGNARQLSSDRTGAVSGPNPPE